MESLLTSLHSYENEAFCNAKSNGFDGMIDTVIKRLTENYARTSLY